MGLLRRKLLNGDRKVGVWGTGYIGFSTMANFAANGVACLGTDVIQSIVDTINEGGIPIPNLEYWLGFPVEPLVKSGMMRATANWKDLIDEEVAVHMIAVPTEKDDKPWDDALIDVTTKISTIADHNTKEAPLVIIESTLTPNRTNEVVIPLLEEKGLKVGEDIHVGVAPRRDWFISPEKNLKNLPRIVGGTTPATTEMMIDVLGIVCDRLVPAPDHRHAEIVKSIENAYRHVEITLANQLSLAFPDIDMVEVLKLVGTKWNIGVFHPSFGTGGYCLAGKEYVAAVLGGDIQFLPIERLYGTIRKAREGEVKVLSYVPNEHRVCFRKVTALSKRQSPTLTFKTFGGYRLTATSNHIMYVRKKKRLWKRLARDLELGDEIPFIRNLPYFKLHTKYPDYLKKGRARKGHVIDLECFAKGVDFRRKIGSGSERLATGQGNSHQTVPRFLRVDQKLAFILGLYAAEGCVTHDGRGLRTYLSVNRNEKELIDKAKSVLDSYAIKYYEYNDKQFQTHQIRVSGAIWGSFISKMTGRNSISAKLPEFLIFWHDRKVRMALLSGLLNGDGYVSERQGRIEFYTASRVLQQQALYLLRSFGLSPTLNVQRDPPMIRLAGCKAREFAKDVFVGDKLDKLNHYLDSVRNKDDRFRNDETRRAVLKEVIAEGHESVYSLEVEGTHNFFATSGWLVHNCIPLSSKYVLSGAKRSDALTILRATVETDEQMPIIVAEHLAKKGVKRVGILGLAYKSDLKVHTLSPTLRIVPHLRAKGVQVKVNDPYYSEEEIRRIVGTETFAFPEGLREFDAVVIVAAHRAYRIVPESMILKNLDNCKLIVDNVEEAWKRVDFSALGIEYHVAGDRGWLGSGE